MSYEERAAIYSRMPLFFIGTSVVAGVYSVLLPSTIPLFALCAFLCFFFVPIRKYLSLLFCVLLGVTWSNLFVRLPPMLEPIYGTVECSFVDIVPSLFHKKETSRCEVWIHSFVDSSGKEVAYGSKAYFFYPSTLHYKGDEKVRFQALLQRKKDFSLQLTHIGPMEVIGKELVSFLSLRLSVREFLMKAFSDLFKDEDVSTILKTLCFSLPCGQDLRKSVHKVGLDHVLGVSGFHFTQLTLCIALAAGFLHRWVFSILAWTCLSFFFLIVGPLPAVFRAWISSTLCIGQKIVGRSPNGFNSLGFGLVCLALYDPCCLSSLSLQLSFIATAALLAFFPHVDRLLQKIFPRHLPESFLSFSFFDQASACCLRFIRASLAVGLSVALVITPYQLAYLAEYPLLGLFANLFLPHFFDLALLATLSLLLIYLVSPLLALPIAFFVEKGVQLLIAIIREAPSPTWAMIQNVHIPPEIASTCIALTLFLGACLRVLSEYKNNEYAHEWMAAV